MPSARFVFLLLSAALLSGCAVGPDYVEPEFEVPDSFVNAPGEATQVQLQWWQSFHDPKLNDLLARAVDNNLELKQALARLNQSRALARKAFTELLPGALVNGEYVNAEQTSVRFPGGGANFRYEVYSGSVDALWELDIFGRLRRQLESRNAQYDRQVAELDDVLRIVFADIASAYIELRATQEQLRIARSNTELQEKSLDLVRTQYKFGVVSELEPARARSQLARTKAYIPTLEAAVKAHMHRIAVLVGEQPTALYSELETPRDIPRYDGPVTIASPETVIRQRPDLRMAERQLASQTADIGVAVGQLFPIVSVYGTIGVAAPSFSELNSSNASFNAFGPRISWAAFDWGRLRADVRFARQAAKEALFVYHQAVLVALEDVENSFSSLAAERTRQAQLLEAERASNQANTIAESQYREGALDFLSVLVSQRTLLERQSDVIEGRKQLALGLISVYRALAGGWTGVLVDESTEELSLSPTEPAVAP